MAHGDVVTTLRADDLLSAQLKQSTAAVRRFGESVQTQLTPATAAVGNFSGAANDTHQALYLLGAVAHSAGIPIAGLAGIARAAGITIRAAGETAALGWKALLGPLALVVIAVSTVIGILKKLEDSWTEQRQKAHESMRAVEARAEQHALFMEAQALRLAEARGEGGEAARLRRGLGRMEEPPTPAEQRLKAIEKEMMGAEGGELTALAWESVNLTDQIWKENAARRKVWEAEDKTTQQKAWEDEGKFIEDIQNKRAMIGVKGRTKEFREEDQAYKQSVDALRQSAREKGLQTDELQDQLRRREELHLEQRADINKRYDAEDAEAAESAAKEEESRAQTLIAFLEQSREQDALNAVTWQEQELIRLAKTEEEKTAITKEAEEQRSQIREEAADKVQALLDKDAAEKRQAAQGQVSLESRILQARLRLQGDVEEARVEQIRSSYAAQIDEARAAGEELKAQQLETLRDLEVEEAGRKEKPEEHVARFEGLQETWKRIQVAAAGGKRDPVQAAVEGAEAAREGAKAANKGARATERSQGTLERILMLLEEVKRGLPLIGAYG